MLVDCGREAYIPDAMLKGQVLYQDILNVYGPLSYQINASLYLLLGISLDTLFMAGLIQTLVILATLYLIFRIFASQAISISLVFFIMASCVYSVWICNYIFPYSYAMLYALGFFLLSVLLCLYSYKYHLPEMGVLSCFFMGMSLACKYEYSFYCIFLFIFLGFLRWKAKYWIGSILAFVSIPCLSFLVLFGQGLTWNSFLEAMNIFWQLPQLKSIQIFYKETVGLFYDQEIFSINVKNLLEFGYNACLAIGLIYILLLFVSNPWLKSRKLSLPRYCQIFILLLATWLFPFSWISEISYVYSFSWLPAVHAIVFVFLLCLGYYQKAWKNWDAHKKLFLGFYFMSFLSGYKGFFFLNLSVYGTYSLPLLLFSLVVFLVEFFPQFFPFLNKKIWQAAWAVFFFFLGISFALFNLQKAYLENVYPFATERGTIYGTEDLAFTFSKAYEYLKENCDARSWFLVIPEGHILNFASDRFSHPRYHSLIPPYVELMGEENIVKSLMHCPPDYIVVHNMELDSYGFRSIGRDFALKIYRFIQENYKVEMRLAKNGFVLFVLKRK